MYFAASYAVPVMLAVGPVASMSRQPSELGDTVPTACVCIPLHAMRGLCQPSAHICKAPYCQHVSVVCSSIAVLNPLT